MAERSMRKVYLVPNFITTANMFCGFYSIVSSVRGEFLNSAWAIVASGVFDMLDGRIARMTKSTSQFGMEYDSQCDLVSFGVAPALLLYQWALHPFGRMGLIGGFLFLTCGALRLARFNVNSHVISKSYFQGLPIPIAAELVATLIIFLHAMEMPKFEGLSILGMTVFLGLLMVSSLPFPSYKEMSWRSRVQFGYLFIGISVLILVAIKPELVLFLVVSSYISLSLVWNLVRILQSFKKEMKLKKLEKV